MEPREPGDPADGSETEKSLAALFFFTLSWRNGLALKSGFNRYIEAGCHRSIETYKPPSTNIYPEFCDALTQVFKKTIYKP